MDDSIQLFEGKLDAYRYMDKMTQKMPERFNLPHKCPIVRCDKILGQNPDIDSLNMSLD
jgi:hypothetical protein